MKRTNIYLDGVQTANLESDLHAIAGSFGALRDVESPDRRPGSREEHLDRMWCRTS